VVGKKECLVNKEAGTSKIGKLGSCVRCAESRKGCNDVTVIEWEGTKHTFEVYRKKLEDERERQRSKVMEMRKSIAELEEMVRMSMMKARKEGP
jgi:hypothetical protein